MFRGALVFALTLGIAAPLRLTLGAQTAAEVTEHMNALRDSIRVSAQALGDFRLRRTFALDDSLTEMGVVVYFPKAVLSDQDRAELRAGIAEARASLDAKFGPGTASLVEGTEWRIEIQREQTQALTSARFVEGQTTPDQRRWRAGIPLQSDVVARFVKELAERQAVRQSPKVAAFAGGSFSLFLPDEAYYIALRLLSLSGSSVARRCAAGTLVACRTVLDDAARDQWFAPTDSIVASKGPFPRGVHASVVSVALELGGNRAIEMFARASETDTDIPFLARAAGVTPDSLLHVWHSRMDAAAQANSTISLPVAATALFWSGLFLFAATRRRPK